jgi:uncharacterized protein (DUF1501 family)
MNRRDFLHKASHTLAVSGLIGAIPFRPHLHHGLTSLMNLTTDTDHVVVLIFLNGGNDGLNTVVPVDQYSLMHSLRSHVVLPESKLLTLTATDKVKLHPELTYFRDLYDEGKLKIIQNVGYPEQNFSHFRSTDIWMSGSNANEVVNSGWAGRYLDVEYPGYPIEYPNAEVPDPLSIEIGYGSSLIFQGPINYMGMVIRDPGEFYRLINNTTETVPSTSAGDKLNYVRLIQRQSQLYGEVVKAAADRVPFQTGYPSEGVNALADQLKVVARCIAGGLQTRLYLVQIGGFDTHDNQVNASNHEAGEHATLLRRLNEATKAFMNDLKKNNVADKVLGMTFSEFGRRIVSNASNGTDHGAAAPVLIFGNNLEGGITGANPKLDAQMTYEDNLPMEHDFRQVYASVLNQWLCMGKSDIDNMLGQNFEMLNISQGCQQTTASRDFTQKAGKSLLQVYPNPLNGEANVEFTSLGGYVNIDFMDASGRMVDRIVSGYFPKGKHQITYSTQSLLPGNYICRILTREHVQARALLKR